MSVTIPNHSVLPVFQSDLPTIADFLRASKLPLAINRFLYEDWPNEAAQLAQCTRTIEAWYQNPDSEMLKVVDDATGEIVAHLVLTHKKSAGEGPKEHQNVPEGMVPNVFHRVIKAAAQIQEAVKWVEHLELTHMYVKQSSRRQGIGLGLVKLALREGKEKGLPVFVGAEPQARPLFLGSGFRDTGHVDFDLSELAPENCGFGVFRLSGMISDVK